MVELTNTSVAKIKRVTLYKKTIPCTESEFNNLIHSICKIILRRFDK